MTKAAGWLRPVEPLNDLVQVPFLGERSGKTELVSASLTTAGSVSVCLPVHVFAHTARIDGFTLNSTERCNLSQP